MKGTVRKTHSYVVFGALFVGFAPASILSAYAQEFCRAINVPIPSIRAWHLPHEGTGDTEMDGHKPRITIRANVVRDGPRLILNGTVEMREAVPDFTTFLGAFSRRIFDIDVEAPGCAYRDFGARSGSLDADSGEDNHRWTLYENGNGIVRAASCLSDIEGDEAGRVGCTIDFENITVALGPSQISAPRAAITPGPAFTPAPASTPAPATERPSPMVTPPAFTPRPAPTPTPAPNTEGPTTQAPTTERRPSE